MYSFITKKKEKKTFFQLKTCVCSNLVISINIHLRKKNLYEQHTMETYLLTLSFGINLFYPTSEILSVLNIFISMKRKEMFDFLMLLAMAYMAYKIFSLKILFAFNNVEEVLHFLHSWILIIFCWTISNE